MGTAGKSLSSLQLRILSGVFLCPLVVGLIALGGWYFMGMVMLAAGITFYEWYELVKNSKTNYRDVAIGAVYLTVCFVSFVFIRMGFELGAWLALGAMISVWASDTGAYVIGKNFGKMKLAPKISPNKTWEGFGGAVFFFGLSLLALIVTASFLEPEINAGLDLKPRHWSLVFIAGCLLGAVGQAGDLFKSIFKRRAGVKDSGHLIPGHGGLLDRIDSLLLVSPVFLLMVMLWMG